MLNLFSVNLFQWNKSHKKLLIIYKSWKHSTTIVNYSNNSDGLLKGEKSAEKIYWQKPFTARGIASRNGRWSPPVLGVTQQPREHEPMVNAIYLATLQFVSRVEDIFTFWRQSHIVLFIGSFHCDFKGCSWEKKTAKRLICV